MSIFILFNQEVTTHDIGRSKILGILTERWNMDMKHFSWPFNKIIQISFLTLFYFFEWISCHQGDCEDKFISGMCCRTLSSASVINKNTHVIIPAHRYSRRWTLMSGCHGKHYGGTSFIGRGGLFVRGKNPQQLGFPKRERRKLSSSQLNFSVLAKNG